MESERSWVIDLEMKQAFNNTTDVFNDEIQWMKSSIFRLPEFVKMIKPSVFTPKMVAIGPYHHHKSDLQPLEVHKERALYKFLSRGVKSLDVYIHEMMMVAEELQCSYVDLQKEWRNLENFTRLMITDGCFMLEVMRHDIEHCRHYHRNDPFFSSHAMMHNAPYMRRDMLILENQIPILVFKKLVSIEKDVHEEVAERIITELVVRFFVPRIYQNKDDLIEFTNTIHGFHALDIYRRCHLFIPTKPSRHPMPHVINYVVMRSATRLREAGIKFKLSPSSALTTISFNYFDGNLILPEITVDYNTEHVLLNMMALEHIHAEAGSDISSYVAFMSALVESAEDVQLLRRHGIVKNGLVSNEDFSRLFYSLSQEVMVDQGGSLWRVQWEVEKYCNRQQTKFNAYLQRAYYVLTAGFITFLTLVSTIVSFLQWRNV